MSHDPEDLLPSDVLAELRGQADLRDQTGRWPGDEIRLLSEAGALKAAVGRQWGGDGKGALEQHLLYESIARSSLAVSLILSQRDSAVGLIEASESRLRNELLPRLANGQLFATVGIAQLTTSRQGGAPALRAARVADGSYQIVGLVPWCTGAAHADYIVVGAAIDGGENLLALLPSRSPGVQIDEPMPLVALASTATTSIRCEGVTIPRESVLRIGKQVLTRPNHLPLGQAYLALGLCRGAIDLIGRFNSSVAEKARDRFGEQLSSLRAEVLALSEPGREADANAAAPAIRGRCNDLTLRATHAAVTLYKGTGLLAGHPAQRLAREALFLLVWSCPSPVIDCTVDLLTEPPAGPCDLP
jgi:butyryl-CoA dehydrogenase